MWPQSPASRRLRPSKAAKETTNRTAARVNVGACVGAKTGAATSVGGMMKTFDEFGEFWKWTEEAIKSCRAARAMCPISAPMSVAGRSHGGSGCA